MITFNNKVVTYNHKWINGSGSPVDPYNPLNLPPNTVRVRTSDGNVPNKTDVTSYETATLVSGTTDIYDVYKSGTNFTQILYKSTNVIEVLGANTSNVTDMTYMFNGCSALQSVPLFDTTNVTNMRYMFFGCTSLTNVPLFDTSSVTNMRFMFELCTSLTSVPLFNTSNVTDMEGMFDACSALQSVPLFDTSNVTNTNAMFYNCKALQSVPLFNTSKVTDMSRMFYYCQSLSSVPLFDTSKVTDMSYTFQFCFNVQSGALALYQQASTQTTPPSAHEQTFRNCGSNTTTGRAELSQIPSNWK